MSGDVRVELTLPQAERVLEALGFALAGEGLDSWTAADFRTAQRAQIKITAAIETAQPEASQA